MTPKVQVSSSAATPRSAFTPSKPRLPAPTPVSSRQEKFKEKNEERYAWLLDIKDKNGKRSDDPDYDPRTLYIPKQAWNGFTPFEKQFWEIKVLIQRITNQV